MPDGHRPAPPPLPQPAAAPPVRAALDTAAGGYARAALAPETLRAYCHDRTEFRRKGGITG